MQRLNKIPWAITTAVYMVVVLVASLWPNTSIEEPSPFSMAIHNLCHVPAYAIMTFLLFYTVIAFGQDKVSRYLEEEEKLEGLDAKNLEMKAKFTAFFTAILYGAVIEKTQSLIPGRMSSAIDIMMNTFGAGIMLFIIDTIHAEKIKRNYKDSK